MAVVSHRTPVPQPTPRSPFAHRHNGVMTAYSHPPAPLGSKRAIARLLWEPRQRHTVGLPEARQDGAPDPRSFVVPGLMSPIVPSCPFESAIAPDTRGHGGTLADMRGHWSAQSVSFPS